VRRAPAEGLLLVTVLLWSFNFTALRFGVTHGFEPLAYAPVRWGLAGIALAALARWQKHSLRVGRRDLAILAAVSVVGIFVNQISFVYALRLVSASTVVTNPYLYSRFASSSMVSVDVDIGSFAGRFQFSVVSFQCGKTDLN